MPPEENEEGQDGNGADAASPEGQGEIVSEVRKPACRVLVVEDSAPLRRMLRRILEMLHLVVDEAKNGREGLEALKRNGPEAYELILLDLMMPVLSGPEFIVAAKKEYGDALPKLIVCSSRSEKQTIRALLKSGIAGYILKPFKTQTIMDKVRESLPDLCTEEEEPAGTESAKDEANAGEEKDEKTSSTEEQNAAESGAKDASAPES